MKDNSDIDYKKMTHYIIIAIVVLALIVLNYCNLHKHVSSNPSLITNYQPKEDELAVYRNPAVAGLFYSKDKAMLDSEVEHYLSSLHSGSEFQPRILIVPHAGYIYSASTAGKAYARLQNFSDKIRNVILLGPSHRVALKGVGLSSADYFTTPLGKIALNKEIIAQLALNPQFKFNDQSHKEEHSLEVQLPFLQKVLKKFQIVPLVYGDVSPQILANAILPLLEQPGTLLVVSADLSHYHDYETAQKLDSQTAQLVEQNKPELENHMSCGATGINAALILAKAQALRPTTIDLINSGDTSNEKDSVVGYGAWSFEKTPSVKEPLSQLEQETQNLRQFAQDYGQELLQIVARSLQKAVTEHKTYSPSRKDYADELFNKGASFVTLKANNELRGCIGTVIPHEAIAQDVAQNTYQAAMEDNRFSPLTQEDLKSLSFSVSLLTRFEPIIYQNAEDLLSKIRAGTDGIIIRDGDRQGLFLPSVWQELPNKEEFMKQLKIKAGINPSYWSENLKVYRFRTVEIKSNEN